MKYSQLHRDQAVHSTTYVGELALDCGDTGSIGDISSADFVATGSSCVAGIAACSNDCTSSALTQAYMHQYNLSVRHTRLHKDGIDNSQTVSDQFKEFIF